MFRIIRIRKPTSNVILERASCFVKVVLVLGTQEWIIQARELNWFKLKESPTNIIFLPLYLARKSNALNLLAETLVLPQDKTWKLKKAEAEDEENMK